MKKKARRPGPGSGQATLFSDPPPMPRRKRTAWRTERGRARGSDPQTAKVAAHSVKTAELEMKVLETLARYPDGLTSHQVSEILDVHLVSISPRFRPLATKNLIHESGATRKGESGRQSIVWKVGAKSPESV